MIGSGRASEGRLKVPLSSSCLVPSPPATNQPPEPGKANSAAPSAPRYCNQPEGRLMSPPQVGTILCNVRALFTAEAPAGQADRDLLARYRADRDESAFAALLQRHGPLVWGVCWRVLRHRQDAEDAFQAAFLVLARRAGAIRQRESLSSWLY